MDLRSEKRNAFTEEINIFALSSKDHQRMQSINSVDTYAYEKSKDLISEKEKIKRNNIIIRYKKSLTLMMLQKKTENNIIQIGQKFPLIHTEY